MSNQSLDQQPDLHKTKAFWDDYQTRGEATRSASWWDSPTIVAECQKLISGNANMNIYQFFRKCLLGCSLEKGVSICSGSGDFERSLIDNNLCRHIDAYEISEERVKKGSAMAKKGGYAIRFHQKDVNHTVFKPDYYDLFFSWSALHHIENLEGVIENAAQCLKKEGVLVAQEYIGPNRFQWTDKQVEMVNRALKRLPEHLRRDPQTGGGREEITRPTIAHMKRTDPSEAVRSSEIIPAIQKRFNIRTLRYFGGAIFHPLFNEIMVNFDHRSNTEVALIEMILLLERAMTEEKILDNDYAIIIAEKK